MQDDLAESSKECGHLRIQVAQLAHNLREGEKRLERCREQLAVAVGREERQVGKAKQTYARLKSAWAQAKGSSKAAGAISAATRELRPVEIVGIYEEQRAQVCPRDCGSWPLPSPPVQLRRQVMHSLRVKDHVRGGRGLHTCYPDTWQSAALRQRQFLCCLSRRMITIAMIAPAATTTPTRLCACRVCCHSCAMKGWGVVGDPRGSTPADVKRDVLTTVAA